MTGVDASTVLSTSQRRRKLARAMQYGFYTMPANDQKKLLGAF